MERRWNEMKLRIKNSTEWPFMKKLLLTCILIMSVLFIAGCIGDEKTDTSTPASSQISQESDTQTTDSTLKPSDVPGLTLDPNYEFLAVPKNTLFVQGNETNLKKYKDALPIGYRNVGEDSQWKDQSGREVRVGLARYDSEPSASIEYCANTADYYEKELEEGRLSIDCDWDWGDPHIGDHSFYRTTTDHNTGIQRTQLSFVYNNNCAGVAVTDEEGKSKKEAIRIAKIIKSRLD